MSQDGSLWWQLEKEIVPGRLTRFDDIVEEWTDAEIGTAAAFLNEFGAKERDLRCKVLAERHAQTRSTGSLDEMIANLDRWMSPWLVECSVDCSVDIVVDFDCSDAPSGRLLGAKAVTVHLADDWTVTRTWWQENDFSFRDVQMFRQRVVPPGCGFVLDCVADQFITLRRIKLMDELRGLLEQSIDEVAALAGTADDGSRGFLTEALRLLRAQHELHFGEE